MPVLFDLELRMATSAHKRYEGISVCVLRSAQFAFMNFPKVKKHPRARDNYNEETSYGII